MDNHRQARALVRVYKHRSYATEPVVQAKLFTLFLAGQAVDFSWRLREHTARRLLTPELAIRYAEQVGLSQFHLNQLLPTLAAVDVVEYATDAAGAITRIEELVGVSAPFATQTAALMNHLGVSPVERAVLASINLASYAPLYRTDHLNEVARIGFTPEQTEEALRLTLAIRANRSLGSPHGDDVVFAPYVWHQSEERIAAFLRSLPRAERDVILSLTNAAAGKPGLALPQVEAQVKPAVIHAAQRVGLVQAATVKSTSNPIHAQTYLFSPLDDALDDAFGTTEALHGRKLFVAHMMFAHERALVPHGRVRSPVVLVEALLNRGVVGPATNIGTDYHLLEAAGIVRVEQSGSRAFLHLIKEEIVRSGLDWLRQVYEPERDPFEAALPHDLRSPAFVEPEANRNRLLGAQRTEEDEIMEFSVQELRKAFARVRDEEEF